MAWHAAVAADWPSTMKTGSMRIEPKAMCEADRQTGTNRLSHSRALGTMRAVTDRIGRETAHLHVALVADLSLGIHVALHVVRIHGVGRQADGIPGNLASLAVVLRHHVLADHPSGFADVELPRPAVLSTNSSLARAPPCHLVADRRRHAGMIGQRPHQALLVLEMAGEDPGPLRV